MWGGSETLSGSQIFLVGDDTINVSGERIRLDDVDTPETYRAKCEYERKFGNMATSRARELVGCLARVELAVHSCCDRYDRLLGRLIVNRVDVGGTLIGEGIARIYDGRRCQGWCW